MSIKQLWAPWRMDFIQEAGKNPSSGCIFCELPKANDDKKTLILKRFENVYIIMNKYPYNNGHLMVVPFRHEKDFSALHDDEGLSMFQAGKVAMDALKTAYAPEGFNVGMNLGLAAGAGVRDHLHLHIVPRWNGDTNFMPIIADVKSVPQHLSTSFDRLREILGR